MMHLIPVEDIRKGDADQTVIVPIRELLKDPQVCYQLVEVVSEQGALIRVRVLDEECIVAHRQLARGRRHNLAVDAPDEEEAVPGLPFSSSSSFLSPFAADEAAVPGAPRAAGMELLLPDLAPCTAAELGREEEPT
eukprot:CAMPEP_0183441178 /NCGR_PEP_ID=MMETSP0370-20130417/83935_1 /TAXON_ID=268820 /ORGANISM="Peridinium aciculiferum, Strain PAER-2" /LENGTH=135 /DNA_ID=CAMNT_0025630293 /DNA_START=383 /DNA_END=787 /DNA_ORIENTATION=+